MLLQPIEGFVMKKSNWTVFGILLGLALIWGLSIGFLLYQNNN